MRIVFNFFDFAGGVTLYQKVNIVDIVWTDSASNEASGGVEIVEAHHQY